ncbi:MULTISPECIES: ATP-binding protein [Alphaproteobacteria]|uniref:Helicase HerA central domain-containing protein n=4 Tax=Nitrobacteraceae TaxID=41294 RepID=K8NXW4_9BRAD|nr:MULTISPECIES: ATP-binding protein [Alphaproteobacteria]MBB1091483.1 ATP-binding protein [Rhodopseudomonas palustris]MBN9597379.1 ATP-binding protein [Afipia sp.]MDD1571334.1 ATP-binding protein [Bradyrhizobium sp. WBOS1]PSO25340.1 ATP-binding protein [Bradyrhizobium sp. MOS004]RTM12963.1 MAG: ATP-binding protein [Bradyrhizobiaceae bacterium]TXH18281.1 MAG: ATP-binding protein [Gammaproteobacteria bacterium]UUO34579.1 ATP-binding protein [Bradyrhizobium sp. WBOS01]
MSRDDRKRAIGKVVSVAADRFVIEMHAGTDNFTVVGFDDVHYVARLGSFLMVAVQTEYVVVEVVGLRERDVGHVSRSEGELDKASSAKYLDVVPVGMLPQDRRERFRFGVSVFPSLYGDALYALDAELDRVFETDHPSEPTPPIDNVPPTPPDATRYRALTIGRSVIFEGYDVKVRIDDFFGGHTAVLGNTGSGKSCTVASVLQSLFEKAEEHHARGATFVVFDVNGEYAKALSPLAKRKQIGVDHVILDGTARTERFRLPHWFLEQSEWELLLQASERTQLPILRMALGLATLFSAGSAAELKGIKNHILATCLSQILRDDTGSPSKHDRMVGLLQRFNTPEINNQKIAPFIKIGFGQMANPAGLTTYLLGNANGGGFIIEGLKFPAYANLPFEFSALGEALDLAILYEEAHGNRQIRDYCSQMLTRFKSLEERPEYAFLRYDLQGSQAGPSLENFLEQLLGLARDGAGWVKRNQIVIIDMNAVEDEVVELVASVLARMAFRLLRQADPRNRFPIHLLLEEAHRYIAEKPSRYAIDASRVYERIAKEGRKYGLFILAASQRPSELSKTILSQCSNFVIHRIQNPDDLAHIRQMTPFISEAVLKRLPSLPKQHALVFGTSVNLPTTFRVRDANPLPASDDARIRDLWFHEEGRAAQVRITPATFEHGDDSVAAEGK